MAYGFVNVNEISFCEKFAVSFRTSLEILEIPGVLPRPGQDGWGCGRKRHRPGWLKSKGRLGGEQEVGAGPESMCYFPWPHAFHPSFVWTNTAAELWICTVVPLESLCTAMEG